MNKINPNKHQLLLYSCPANLPLSFSSHQWFVINKQGSLSRWELLFRDFDHPTRWNHLYKDAFPPFQGIEVFPYTKGPLWNSKLLATVDGELAQQMATFIENTPTTYPYNDKYSVLRPNSNTYIQWVLNHFPEASITLPWNAFGRGYAATITTEQK